MTGFAFFVCIFIISAVVVVEPAKRRDRMCKAFRDTQPNSQEKCGGGGENSTATRGKPPRVAICLNGHVRSFQTQAVRVSLKVHLIEPLLSGASGLDIFAFLKTSHSSTGTTGAYWNDKSATHSGAGLNLNSGDMNAEDLIGALGNLGATTVAVVEVVDGTCSPGELEHEAECTSAPPKFPRCTGPLLNNRGEIVGPAPSSSSFVVGANSSDESMKQRRRRLAGAHTRVGCLAQMFGMNRCLVSIRAAEVYREEAYGLVVRARPDLFYPSRFPPPCAWPQSSVTHFSDFIAIFPRPLVDALGFGWRINECAPPIFQTNGKMAVNNFSAGTMCWWARPEDVLDQAFKVNGVHATDCWPVTATGVAPPSKVEVRETRDDDDVFEPPALYRGAVGVVVKSGWVISENLKKVEEVAVKAAEEAAAAAAAVSTTGVVVGEGTEITQKEAFFHAQKWVQRYDSRYGPGRAALLPLELQRAFEEDSRAPQMGWSECLKPHSNSLLNALRMVPYPGLDPGLDSSLNPNDASSSSSSSAQLQPEESNTSTGSTDSSSSSTDSSSSSSSSSSTDSTSRGASLMAVNYEQQITRHAAAQRAIAAMLRGDGGEGVVAREARTAGVTAIPQHL